MKLKDILNVELSTEDFELIKGIGILIVLSGIIIITSFIIMTFIYFYSSPIMIILMAILLLLRIRICGAEIDISPAKILNRYFKISMTLIR